MSGKEKINILLVDDQPAKLVSYAAILDDLGENLIEANCGREALEHLLKTDIAVVLVDVCMPDIDGFELAAMIREHPRCQKTAIIFVSAIHMTDLDRLRGYECGAVDYVPVPIVPDLLRARVAVFADLYRKTEQLERLNRELEDRVAERTGALEASTARLRESEKRLREADRRKDEFLAMLSHELRNPLAPIRNAVKVLGLLGTSDGQFTKAREIIDRQVEHMTRLVDDLLDVSRLTSGKIVLRQETLLLSEVIEAAIEASRPLIEQHEHSLSVHLSEAPIRLEGDCARMVQVVANLLTNAAKFTPKGGHVTVTVERGPGCAVIRVRDTGVGIPRDAQARVFELFAQEDATFARSQGGLGIGLTLVRQLVEMHGGRVEVESEGHGKGSEFIVTLPAFPAAEPTTSAAEGYEAPREPARLRVLVVEDNIDTAESFKMLLELAGHDVAIVHDGIGALRLVDDFEPHVAFIDLGLPELDGFEVARRIRKSHPRKPLLLALSGYGREEDKQESKAAGFDEHLVKPVDVDTVLGYLATFGGSVLAPESSVLVH